MWYAPRLNDAHFRTTSIATIGLMTRPSTKPNAMKPARNRQDRSVSKPQIQPLTTAHTKSVKPPTNPSLPAASRDNVNRARQDEQVNVLPLKSKRHLEYGAPHRGHVSL
jgi:hypothetical protein